MSVLEYQRYAKQNKAKNKQTKTQDFFALSKSRALCYIQTARVYHSFQKNTHREKSTSNQIPAPTKNMTMDIWVVDISKQLFISGS